MDEPWKPRLVRGLRWVRSRGAGRCTSNWSLDQTSELQYTLGNDRQPGRHSLLSNFELVVAGRLFLARLDGLDTGCWQVCLHGTSVLPGVHLRDGLGQYSEYEGALQCKENPRERGVHGHEAERLRADQAW